jgi:hypothetical protein
MRNLAPVFHFAIIHFTNARVIQEPIHGKHTRKGEESSELLLDLKSIDSLLSPGHFYASSKESNEYEFGLTREPSGNRPGQALSWIISTGTEAKSC